MYKEISWIEIAPDSFGWKIRIYTTGEDGIPTQHIFGIGDAMQFVHETERTLGRWLADGPADFHGPRFQNREALEIAPEYGTDPDLVRDLERGK